MMYIKTKSKNIRSVNIYRSTIAVAATTFLMMACGGGSQTSASDVKASADSQATAQAAGTATSSPESATAKALAVPPGWVGRKPVSDAAAKINQLEASGQLPKLDGSASLAGPDTNANGIRDDIDAYIASKSYLAPQKAAMAQSARALQKTLTTDLNNLAAVEATNLTLGKATSCILSRFRSPSDPESGLGATEAEALESFTTNTKPRLMAYIKFANALDGSVFRGVKDSCD